ncbi:hypothetical protein I4U23_003048 [Adineta vaga]|nr:hypothetical protein I4U23_003048 [Adineta vaga]
MNIVVYSRYWLIMTLLINRISGSTYNVPRFSSCAVWNPNAITFADSTAIGSLPRGIYVDKNNSVYVAETSRHAVQIWLEGSNVPVRNITGGFFNPYSVFPSITGDIYVDDSSTNRRVQKWMLNSTNGIVDMYVNGTCYGLFVDINGSLYCSMEPGHQVIKKTIGNDANTTTVVAGVGYSGNASNMLDGPRGIFVSKTFDLYVADCYNHRVQRFQLNQLNATTVAGNGASGTMALDRPIGVILDGDGYLFIAEFNNHRIVGSGPNGFRCIVGCTGTSGSTVNQLKYPHGLSFDSYGNLFVADTDNNRIQKFLLSTNTCGLSFNQPKLCVSATWNSNGTTVANSNSVGISPHDLFVDFNNTVYVADRSNKRVQVWLEGTSSPIKTVSGGLNNPYSIFISSKKDFYVDNSASNKRIDKWTSNSSSSVMVMNVSGICFGLFIDIKDDLYCSMDSPNKVVKKSLNNLSDTIKTVAGNGPAGSAATMLNGPRGIFVDKNLTLYVADCWNNRIQVFYRGQLNGITVSINSSNGSLTLNCPTEVILDFDGYLFLTDCFNNRILGSDSTGFRCIAGCTRVAGIAANQLGRPHSLGFDSYGNLFVIEESNNRLQKFSLISNGCDQTTTELHQEQTSIVTTTMTSSTPTTYSVNQSCFSPTVTLISITSSRFSPLRYRRKQHFYISSYIQLNCDSSLSAIIKWTIHNCTLIQCSSPIQIDSTIVTTYSELYIPAQTLPLGTFELKLTVTMVASSNLSSSSSTYVEITPSGIVSNLVPYGTSMITYGQQQNLTLDPGTFSIDLDGNTFNASDWNYVYYCRIYGLYDFPHSSGRLLSIDEARINSHNSSCISNQAGNTTSLVYGGSNISPNSSLIISGGSLLSNRTYQFMVYMENLKNSSSQATGYLLVRIKDTHSQMIVIGCVISTMCVPNLEFQLVNPTTQVALFSLCLEDCSALLNITWSIYTGTNGSLANMQWTLFTQMNQYKDIWFFGTSTSNFTATTKLFINNPQIVYWRFEVIYTFTNKTSSSALNFIVNQPPRNGTCSISPLNGTITTVFTVSCSNWFDEDEIQDYALYGYTKDQSIPTIIGFSSLSSFNVRLPCGGGDDNTSLLHLNVIVRDRLNCVTEINITSVIVTTDASMIDNLVSILGNPTNPIVQLLSSGNQNIVGQILISLSQQFNKINAQLLDSAITNGIPPSSVSVSSFGTQTLPNISDTLNTTALTEYNKQVNLQANVRDYLMTFLPNLAITTSNSIELQASALVQLTEATNQLTRTSAMIASEKCYQLAQALSSMSIKISYENVRNAAKQIAQCTSNVLTAINSPLQERTTILDLDYSRANSLPKDYDTDVESEWINPNLFADGNDFSWETIQKNRNLYYQKQTAEKIRSQTKETTRLLTTALNHHLNIGQNITMNTSSVIMSIETFLIGYLANKLIEPIGNAQINLPSIFNTNLPYSQTISLRSIIQPLASADKSQVKSNTNLSTLVSLSILDNNGNEISLPTTLTHPYRFVIPRDPQMIISSMTVQNVTAFYNIPHHFLFNLHHINIEQSNNLTISIHFEMKTWNQSLAYLFIYRFDQSPHLNSSTREIDDFSVFCPSNLTIDNIYKYFIDNEKTKNHHTVIFGLRELNSTEMFQYCTNQSMINSHIPPVSDQAFHFTSNYELRIYTSGCYYFDEQSNQWSSYGLLVGSRTNHHESECFSTHLTTFAGGFLVLPAPINWNYVFANADFNKNKTIYLTVICISILYLLLILYARYKDKKDIQKLGVTALTDNYKEDQYCYQILVFTGHRKDSGTKSKVHFIIAGNEDETTVRTFTDPHRQIFQRGGIDAFVMTVPKSLGGLNYIRIWHDNQGDGSSSSWFLKYIIIRDLQTLEKSYFICQRWLAVEKGDGQIERVLPIAGEVQQQEFSYVLSKQAYHSVSEGHLWFSIFSRPPSNQFTRVQRCTCCFVLLLTSMLLNILYYDQAQDAKAKNSNSASLSIGPLYITPEQIGIGIIVELLVFVPSLLLVQLFRRIQPQRNHQQRISPLRQTLYKIKQHTTLDTTVPIEQKKKSKLSFPWWFLFIAYGLSFLLAVISIFLIIVRGIEFGDLKTQKWLTSLLSGFFSSILLIEPIKILLLAIFFACFIRKSNHDKEAAEYLDDDANVGLDDDEEYLKSINDNSPFSHRTQRRPNRLTEGEIDFIRRRRFQELKMWSFIREIFTYACFLSLLYVVIYSNVNTNAFHEVHHLRKFFLHSENINEDYTKISTINSYWYWLENNFVKKIRAQKWYNGDAPRNLSGFIDDKSNRLIGWVTMRQLRIKSYLCPAKQQEVVSKCEDDYSFGNEETDSFQPGWASYNQTITQTYNSTILRAFTYRNGDELDTYSYVGEHRTYSSGGYVYEFRGRLSNLQSNLSKLYELGWIDTQTRAIIIQCTLYNPNVGLFTSITLLTEFLSTGGLYPQSRFEPLSFQLFTSITQLICSIFYMIFIIYMMIEEIRSVLQMKMKYFFQFWTYVNIGIIVCSWTSVGIYIWRYIESKRIGQLFQETNGYVYINLQLAVYINDTFTYLVGFCCFFGTVKFVRLCRVNRRILLFLTTIRHAAKELLSFSMMFSIMFTSFICLFYFLFISKLSTCSSIFQTTRMLFEMTLMKFDAYELVDASSFLGPFCFSLFILLMVFVCLSMFITIINDSFRFARDNLHKHQTEDEQIIGYMIKKFRRWIGHSNQIEIIEERDIQMRNDYRNPVDHFPYKIDQLLAALNNVYVSQKHIVSNQ